MATKIKKRTPAQEARIAEFRDRWLSIGLSTQPTDCKKSEAAVDEAYRRAKLTPPKLRIWLASPMAGAIGAEIILRWAQVGAQVGAQVCRAGHGLHDANWLGFHEYIRDVLGLEQEIAPMLGLMDLAQWCGWWWPFEGAVILTEKPTALHRDSRNRLHNENGPAIAYSDGWGVWALHGVRVQQADIEQTLSVTRIRDEQNAEIRRVLADKYGAAKYVQDVGAKRIHKDRFGELYHVEMPGDEPIEMVKVRNSTPESDGSIKCYWLRVAPGAKTAHEAVASTFINPLTGQRLTAAEYQPITET
jgi:hypothetical protein